MKWHIGQPIVAIENHSQGVFKRGDEFIIKNVISYSCGHIKLDIGIKSNYSINQCGVCKSIQHADDIWWFTEVIFAPLDVDISELTEILKEPIIQHK